MISSLDHALIGLYLTCVIFAGILVKSPRSSSGYIFAGRKLTVPAFVMTLVSTWYGGILEVGRFAHINGISTILIFGLFYYIAALVYAYAMVPRIKSSEFETIPQAISSAFGKKSGVVAALLILFISSPAPYIKILSVFLDFLYGITPLYGALLCAAVSILYTLRGGFQAVIKTDIIQFINQSIGKEIQLDIKRGDQTVNLTVVPEPKQEGSQLGVIGIMIHTEVVRHHPIKSVYLGGKATWSNIQLVFKSLGYLIKGKASVKEMAGPIGIVQFASFTLSRGWVHFLDIMAMISISLGIFNLFPIPVLDGGHLVFLTIEAIQRKPVSKKWETIINNMGAVLLIGLMILVVFNDISTWTSRINLLHSLPK